MTGGDARRRISTIIVTSHSAPNITAAVCDAISAPVDEAGCSTLSIVGALLALADGVALSAFTSMTVTINNTPAESNLLVNAGFEDGALTPWTSLGGTVTSNAALVRSGTRAGSLTGNTTDWRYIRQKVNVVAGEIYQFSGRLSTTNRTNTGNYYMFEIRWYGSSGAEVGQRTSFGITYGNSAYTRHVQNQVAPTGAVHAELRIQSNQADGTAYIDDQRACPECHRLFSRQSSNIGGAGLAEGRRGRRGFYAHRCVVPQAIKKGADAPFFIATE